MTDHERERFDALFEQALEQLPDHLRALLDTVPMLVDDRPEPELEASLAEEFEVDTREEPDWADTLCGLHTGIPLTERSVEQAADIPDHIHIFREGIVNTAGGWEQEGEPAEDAEDAIFEEIWITILHEMGHHFGLDEEQLEALGYD